MIFLEFIDNMEDFYLKLEFAKKCVILHPLSREKRGKALTE